MQDALAGLPSVKIVRVDLAHDQFGLEHDPAKVTVVRIEETVRGLGYAPKIIEGDTHVASASSIIRVDPKTLPTELAAAFEEAKHAKQGVVISFFGHG